MTPHPSPDTVTRGRGQVCQNHGTDPHDHRSRREGLPTTRDATHGANPAIWRLGLAAAGGTCIANAGWWMQPLLMHDMSQVRGLGDFAAGMVLTVEMACMAIASVVSARVFVGRSLQLLTLAGLVLAIGGNALSLLHLPYGALLLARGLAGTGAGLGLLLMNSTAALFSDPDRAFARLSVVSIVFGMVITGAMPVAEHLPGFASPFAMVLLSLLVTVPAVAVLPRGITVRHSEPHPQQELARGSGLRIATLAIITFLIGCVSGTMWVFYALIGQQAGLDMPGIDGAISMAVFAALIAAGVASLIGGRLGRVLPAVIGLAALAMAVAVLSNHPDAAAFRLATMGNIGALYFLTPYLFGAAAAQDPSGRGAVYVGSAFYLTGAVGPAFGGLISTTIGMGVVGMITIVVAGVSALAFWRVERGAAPQAQDFAHEGPVMALHARD
jgi:predicted MFS family arabinose efflux permease